MANHAGEATSDNFFDQILGFPPYTRAVPNLAGIQSSPAMLQLNSGGGGGFEFPLGSMNTSGSVKSGFQAQSMHKAFPTRAHPAAIPQRMRAKRGQATDPHSIAERTDKATMLDEIVDYVKFLRLQVKVLSMSRLGGAGAVGPLATDIPISSIEEEGSEDERNQTPWEKWSDDGTERQVAKLMEENVGAAVQLLQSKALCIMPISLASVIYHTQPPDSATLVNPKSDHHS